MHLLETVTETKTDLKKIYYYYYCGLLFNAKDSLSNLSCSTALVGNTADNLIMDVWCIAIKGCTYSYIDIHYREELGMQRNIIIATKTKIQN